MNLFNQFDSRVIPFDCLQLCEMARAYRGGASSRELSAIYGISQSAILRRLRALGVRVRRMGVSSDVAIARAAK